MASWADIEASAPEFAGRVRARFDAGTNKTMATLRRDGSPRISGTELDFAGGEATLGMGTEGVKYADVCRDPRVAIHCPTLEPPDEPGTWEGDAKLAGRLVRVAPPGDSPHRGAGHFRLDITEAVLTYVGVPADHLVIESWHEGTGWRRRTRR